jgi:hypothetical protein
MAFTVSTEPTVFGNKNARLIKITADAAEGNVTTGFNVIDFMVVSKPISMATANNYVQANKNSSGTASNGTIGISGTSSGAEFHCLVFGK